MKQADLPYGSSGIKNLDTGYGNFGTIKESLREQNRDSSIPNEKENENNKNNFELDEKNIEENNPSEDSKEYEKFNNGILKDIIKEQQEVLIDYYIKAQEMVMELMIFILNVMKLKKL